jgi:hypothetical protein
LEGGLVTPSILLKQFTFRFGLYSKIPATGQYAGGSSRVVAFHGLGANGVLTGNYHGHGNIDAGRMSTQQMREFLPEQERTQRIITALKSVAEQTGRSMPQVALAWQR